MVCVPCIIIPVLLYIWHRFFQPMVLKFWNPWKAVGSTTQPNVTRKLCPKSGNSDTGSKTDTSSISEDDLPEKLSNGVIFSEEAKVKTK